MTETDAQNQRRRVAVVWDVTQSVLAVMVIGANILVAVTTSLGYAPRGEIPHSLDSAMFLVLGFYFARASTTGTKPERASDATNGHGR